MTTIRVAIPKTVLFRDLGGEMVLLAQESGRYFGLNGVGTHFWNLLHLHGETEAVCRDLFEEYEVGEPRLREDLARFVETLAAKGLLEVWPADG